MQSDYTFSRFPTMFSPIDKKEHLKMWSEKYCAGKLRDHGFVDYNKDALCWYRVINSEVLQAVFIFNNWRYVPLEPVFCCVMQPLFVDVPIPYKITVSGSISLNDGFPVYLNHPRAVLDEQCQVMGTDSPEGGAEKLEEVVFPTFSQVSSFDEMYAYFKTKWLGGFCCFTNQKEPMCQPKEGFYLTLSMIEMAIYRNDQQMYPDCIKQLEGHLACGKFCICKDRVNAAWAAIQEGKREEFLQVLEKTKKKVCRKLERKLGIHI